VVDGPVDWLPRPRSTSEFLDLGTRACSTTTRHARQLSAEVGSLGRPPSKPHKLGTVRTAGC
jgi:hypothetical protein